MFIKVYNKCCKATSCDSCSFRHALNVTSPCPRLSRCIRPRPGSTLPVAQLAKCQPGNPKFLGCSKTASHGCRSMIAEIGVSEIFRCINIYKNLQ